MRRPVISGAGLAVVWLLLVIQPVAAITYCWGGANVGAWWSQETSSYSGVRSEQDFESATVPTGTAIVHPMQVAMDNGDFLGWGTARGVGVDNCADDYTAHWKVYIDGYKFGDYFCIQDFGEIAGTATNQLFTLRYGDCNGTNKYRAFLNGVRLSCQAINGSVADHLAAGSEVIGTTGQLHADIHYDDLSRYYAVTDNWSAWNSALADDCESEGYRVRVIAADDVWTEEIP